MGFFSLLFKPKAPKDKLIGWLNEVDQAYSRAFQIKNASGLAPYLTRGCLSKQMERIRVCEKAYAGIDRYKHVKWEKQAGDNPLVYIKTVTYDHVKMSHGIKSAVGEDYREQWEIVMENNKHHVSVIRRIL